MTTDRKINEAGWFYHAPARRKVSAEPVQVPLTSQIPGLNDLPPEDCNAQHEILFKDTDSKYTRLAKQGGRKDLLVIKEQPKRTREPKGYPRVDWFYLEDNAAEDAVEKKKGWEFLLPEYMVHDPTSSDNHLDGEREQAKRAPYATDNMPLFTHDGPSLTDKTVKLPEARRAGYGVRSNRPLRFPKQPPRERPIMPPSDTNLQGERTRRRCVPEISKERVEMHKLLSFEYNKEWHQSVDKECPPKEDKSKSGLTFFDQQESIGKYSAGNSRHRRELTSKVTEDKEPFIMSKFKNVPARVDSHQKFDNHESPPKHATQTTDG